MLGARLLPLLSLRRIACATIAGALLGAAGCSNVEEARPRPEAVSAPTIPMDVPPIMRGTIASVARLDGYNDDTIVHGYGFVVGLDGTGGRLLPEPIRAHMLQEMSRRGVGKVSLGSEIPPERLLDSPDTAVVIVEAVIPPGAVKGEQFDVRVSLPPQSDVTSLEGGTLWTTELRPALGPLPRTGSRQASAVALARGPVFTNPFVIMPEGSEAANANSIEIQAGTTINMTTGHVLGGGVVTRDMPMKLRLATPSHNQASILQQVINSRFPQEPGQRAKTARAENEASIEITVPPSYHSRSREFVHVLQHTTIRMPAIEAVVSFINRNLVATPGDAEHAMWRWIALGKQALPGIRHFYDYTEEQPRYAALYAGATLDDGLVVPHLLDLARNGSPAVRKDAIALLGEMQPDPRVVFELQDLLNDEDVDIRIAAYESLRILGSPLVRSELIEDKYIVDYVQSEYPLVYVTLLDAPRIVVFGKNLEIETPMTLAAWSNRFLVKGDSGDEELEVLYRDPSGESNRYEASANLREFIQFLGHRTTIEQPAPGLDLTYSETIGVLWSMYQARYLPAEFRTQRDRILVAIQERAQQPDAYEPRPEFNDSPPADEPSLPEDLLREDMMRAPDAGIRTGDARTDR